MACFFTILFLWTTCYHAWEIFLQSGGQVALVRNVTVVKKVEDYFDCSFLCLEYGPFTCLSFNFGRNNYHGYHSCEISNSERYYEPHKIQERLGFDYYGTTYEVSWDPINSHFTPNLRDIGPFYTGGCIIRLYGLRKTFVFNWSGL